MPAEHSGRAGGSFRIPASWDAGDGLTIRTLIRSARAAALPRAAGLLYACLLAASGPDARAACREFGGFAIFQCAELAYFAPVPDPGFTLRTDSTGRATNITAIFWQIGFGNQTLNNGQGSNGTGMAGATVFNGNDQGNLLVDLADAAAALRNPAIPPGATCLRNNNWGNSGVDGCCDDDRAGATLTYSDDGILNPYYAVDEAKNQNQGIYSLTWQQDYPMAVLLKTQDGRWFALAAVATISRNNIGGGENGSCASARGTNPAPCDFRMGHYNFSTVTTGLRNPAAGGAANVIPWQETPVPKIVKEEAGSSGSRKVQLVWSAAVMHNDGSHRPSTNPTLGATSGRAAGVGVMDIGARYPLVRYYLQVARANDPDFRSPINSLETFANQATISLPAGSCFRLRTLFGKKPESAAIGAAACRVAACGDLGYEVVSETVCPGVGGDEDGDGLNGAQDNCPGIYNPGHEDSDTDGRGDLCDNCPQAPNVDQMDADGDGTGDACDDCQDVDHDGSCDGEGTEEPEAEPFEAPGDQPGEAGSSGGGGGDAGGPGVTPGEAAAAGEAAAVGAGAAAATEGSRGTESQPNTEPGSGKAGTAAAKPLDPEGDEDKDGVLNKDDDCPLVKNEDQADADADRSGDVCDVCPSIYDPGQEDADGDGRGSDCDLCRDAYNPDQADQDLDRKGNACDVCQAVYNPDQADRDGDGRGDVCDLCPSAYNPDQRDGDGDGAGDGCDDCVSTYNADQRDVDGDKVGDACDDCPAAYNPAQADSDRDGQGDACDLTITSPPSGSTFSCKGPPPKIAWTANGFGRFQVFIATAKDFKNATVKSSVLEGATSWTVPASDWATACAQAKGSLNIKVAGADPKKKSSEISTAVAVQVR